MANSNQVCGVVLPKRVAHTARVVAAKEGKSRSALMRDLLVAYLQGEIVLDAAIEPLSSGKSGFAVKDHA